MNGSTPRSAGRRGRPTTMQDIALATGVSRSTVSRILSNAVLQVRVSPDTRERVLATARELDYRPNPLARALRGAPTMLLGAIVRDITDPFFAGAIEAISGAARARGYNIVLGLAHARATEAHELAAVLEARQCDGIIVLGDMGDQPRLLADLAEAHVPVVAMWQGTILDLIPGVQVDNRLGIRTAIDHLVGLGHRQIAFVGGRPLGDIRERQTAFTEAMLEILDDLPAGYVQHAPNTTAGGEAALGALLRVAPRPTAIVASTDVLAMGVLRSALVRGISVPGELSVVGFDDIAMATVAVPRLTTIRMPMAAMAAQAIALLVGEAETDAIPVDPDARAGRSIVRVFPPSIVLRESTAPPIVARAPGREAVP